MNLIGILALVNLARLGLLLHDSHSSLLKPLGLFYLDSERSIPTWYNSFLLFACAAALWLVARSMRPGEPFRLHWRILALMLLLCAVDEVAQFHERSMYVLERVIPRRGLLYYPWVLPAAVLVCLLSLSMRRMVYSLPRTTRRLFFFAAAVYLMGALGMECLGGLWVETHGTGNFVSELCIIAEETMELSGAALFLYAVLRHLQSRVSEIRIDLSATDIAEAEPLHILCTGCTGHPTPLLSGACIPQHCDVPDIAGSTAAAPGLPRRLDR